MMKVFFSMILLGGLCTAEAQSPSFGSLPLSRSASDRYRSCSSLEDYADYLDYFLQKNRNAKERMPLKDLQKLAQSMSFKCQRQFPLFRKTEAALLRWGFPSFVVEKVATDLFRQEIRNPKKLEEVLNSSLPAELRKLPIGVSEDLLAVFTREPLPGNDLSFTNYLSHGAEYMQICLREIYKDSVDKCRRSLIDIFSVYGLYTTMSIPVLARQISASYDSLYSEKLPVALKDKGKIVANILKLGPGAGEAFSQAIRNERMRALHRDHPDILLESALLLALKGFSWKDSY